MRLYIAGIAHADPLGPKRLETWLADLRAQHAEEPAFIGVEWDETIFNSVKAQRDILRSLAKSEWPDAPATFIDALANAMAYEADTHLSVFPTAKIIWLDAERKPDVESDIAEFAQLRMRIYRSAAREIARHDDDALQHMSNKIWAMIQLRPNGADTRDDHLARRIFASTQQARSDWALAIIGADHASDAPGSVVDILIHNGLECIVRIMSP